MPRLSVIAAALILISASGYKITAKSLDPELLDTSDKKEMPITQEEMESLKLDLNHKLFALHSYHVIAQRNLIKFDSSLQELEIKDIYNTYTYLNLTAARTQIERIEREIQDLQKMRPALTQQIVTEFSKKSLVHQLTMSSLSEKLKLPSEKRLTVAPLKIEKEYQELLKSREFQVFEKNIEHLAHLHKGKTKKSSRMPASLSDNRDSWESSSLTQTQFNPETIDTLDWLAQSSDKITARTTRIHHHLSRRK